MAAPQIFTTQTVVGLACGIIITLVLQQTLSRNGSINACPPAEKETTVVVEQPQCPAQAGGTGAATSASSSATNAHWTPFPKSSHPRAVDCNQFGAVSPMRSTLFESRSAPYMVSYSWWDRRGSQYDTKGQAKDYKTATLSDSNESVREVQKLLDQSPGGAALVDVGANVGFMTFYAPATNRPVYAFDPIGYDISKICEGWWINHAQGLLSADKASLVNIFHMAVGPTSNPEKVDIFRPKVSVGYFDQSSLSSNAIVMSQSNIESEKVEMVALDDIIPTDVPVGLVKIDVQGHEYGVLKGMQKIMARSSGFPKYILFEDDPNLTTRAGFTPGACKTLVEAAGYTCTRSNEQDTLCTR